ncbi:MFS transporter [Flammeovirga kamogawensis]|uniref:MFS transporter n=1 Tax=Flammeovirga kamogawensis TaxID=373891 RepID=A0ABX8GQL9_9BACT|nr:MFS transporter [Flammeovirga kamogawensis]MBB6462126.1 PAT family beta-lactamase induction signal transducer AmpG [Flammeovirga kamogawensis]QWG05860.1 MFS transporter [Flammeovirga kamogawensis]TRX67684.1 AmpG family muropeptide MFS transporter [Flammeovirga kamogawensis]
MQKDRNPWTWLPSLYFVEGLPYTIVMTVAVIMYKNLGLNNTEIALYTSWLYLPWVIKPFWSPIVDVLQTKKWWISTMQLIIGGAFAAVALTLPMDNFFKYSLAAFWIVAFTSATNDIATDGFYMIGLRDDQQAFFVGIRSTFYRLAMWAGQGGIVFLTGHFYKQYGDYKTIWATTFLGLGVAMISFGILHKIILPNKEVVRPQKEQEKGLKEVGIIFSQMCIILLGGWLINEFTGYNTSWTYLILGIAVGIFMVSDLKKKIKKNPEKMNSPILSFFNKKDLFNVIGFILLYRLGEAQLVKIATPFLLDDRAIGGLGLTNDDLGLLYGTIGLACLVVGGILGGMAIYKKGLKFWLVPMLLSINLPNIGYMLLAYFQPENLIYTGIVIAIEQFFYGFGFTALMMYMLYVSQGENKTAHYAVCTGFMALGMMLPGMISGYFQEFLGYSNFFILVVFSGIPAILMGFNLKIDQTFGLKD